VRKVRVAMSKTAVDLHGIFPRYKAKFEASAIDSLRDGRDTARSRTVARAVRARALRRSDPAQVRGRAVEVTADPKLTGVQAVVEAETADGKTLSVRCEHPRGSAENPLTREQIENKFRTYAAARLSDAHVEQVIAAVGQLEQLGSATQLMDMLRAGSERRLRASAAA
jgi:2-methylcitrate dehydratase PrpD